MSTSSHASTVRTGSAPITSRRPGRPRRRIAIAAGAVLTTGLGAALLGGLASPAAAAVTQTGSCVDGGGVRWNAKAVWGSPYTASDGIVRIRMDYAGWTTTRAGSVPTDSWVRIYNGSGQLHQGSSWTGSFDYAGGTAWKVRNPADPASAPGRVQLRITLGVNGDGYGNCTVTFTQPVAASPTPTDASSPPATATPTATASPAPTPPTSPTSTAPASPSTSTTPTATASSTSGTAGDRYQADVFTATNHERTSRGLVAFSTDGCVDSFAEAQAARMAAEDRLYHQDLNPILRECGLTGVGENVAFGYGSGTEVVAGWMNSSGHRANILNASYRLLGVGAAQNAQGRWYACQVFGTR